MARHDDGADDAALAAAADPDDAADADLDGDDGDDDWDDVTIPEQVSPAPELPCSIAAALACERELAARRRRAAAPRAATAHDATVAAIPAARRRSTLVRFVRLRPRATGALAVVATALAAALVIATP